MVFNTFYVWILDSEQQKTADAYDNNVSGSRGYSYTKIYTYKFYILQ
jgi:hypothetical protein